MILRITVVYGFGRQTIKQRSCQLFIQTDVLDKMTKVVWSR
jgi:hypothetical protein